MKKTSSNVQRNFATRSFALVSLLALSTAFLNPALASEHIHHSRTSIDYTAHNVPLRTALLDVARLSRRSIALGDSIDGYVTIELHQASLKGALTALLTTHGYRYTILADVITVERNAADARTPKNSATPSIIPLSIIAPERAAKMLRSLYPQATIQIDHHANALLVLATQDEQTQIRSLIQGLDVQSPSHTEVDVLTLHTLQASSVQGRLHALFPQLHIMASDAHHLMVRGTIIDQAEIKTVVASLDTPLDAPAPQVVTSDIVHIVSADPKILARAIARQFPHLRISMNQGSILLRGASDDISQAKVLIGQLDYPAPTQRTTVARRLRTLDALATAKLLEKSFPRCDIQADADINALMITATAADQTRIATALDVLEPSATSAGAPGAGSELPGNFEVVSLRSAIPNQGSAGNVAISDSVAPITAALQQLLPTLKVVPLPQPGMLGLMGDVVTLRSAKAYLAQLDQLAPLVVLDTKIIEIDESIARNLGLNFPSPVISTSFSEFTPSDSSGRIIKLQPITRTIPLSLQAQFNFLVQNGTARVLADPRITTLSGRTATIRAGDTLGILTTVGGGTGTYATSQLQTFQTGVTLDITPLVSSVGDITVALHPVVNSLSGILNGVPQISTRDTQTTVRLRDNQTLIIGGLIQENRQETISKLPLVGDLPLVGKALSNNQVNGTRNELIIIVTPHIVDPPNDSVGTTAASPITNIAHASQIPQGLVAPMPQPAASSLDKPKDPGSP